MFSSNSWDDVPIGSNLDIWSPPLSPNEWPIDTGSSKVQAGIKGVLSTQRSYYVINKCQNTPEETSFRNAAVVNTIGCLPVRLSFMLLHPCRQKPDFVQGSVFLRKIRSCVFEEEKANHGGLITFAIILDWLRQSKYFNSGQRDVTGSLAGST